MALQVHFRRATVEDLPKLRGLWRTALLPAQDLEKTLTEFQLAEGLDGRLMGALGFQILNQDARIYGEAYTHSETESLVKPQLWNRLKVLAANQGVHRIWTQEKSAFWPQQGFGGATVEDCKQLPKSFQRASGSWRTLTLRDEAAEQRIQREAGLFEAAREKNQSRLSLQAKAIRWILGFVAVGFCAALFYFAVRALIR